MRFIFYSPVHFEKWDWRNSVERGIGGSETSHVEMAWRLARRGHEVITYAPIPEDCPGEWKNTKWFDYTEVDWTLKGVWILYRCPDAVDHFPKKEDRQDQTLWLMMQDWDYPNWTDERITNTDKVITLCKAHGRDVVRAHPLIKNNLWLSSNGVKTDLIEEVLEEGIPHRNPHKIIFASSPDRGLRYVVQSFERAREVVPTLELHAFYGFDNLNKLRERNPFLKKVAEETEALLTRPGVVWHGRVSQKELYREWLSAGMWVYQTNFNETSCITSMEAQSLGAIPIVNPIYALSENVLYGTGIEGDAYSDPLTKARFAAEIVRWSNPDLQETLRSEMMHNARERFDWEKFVDQWECMAEGKEFPHSFPVQLTEEELESAAGLHSADQV